MRDTITKAVQDALQTLGLPVVDFVVEHPRELSHGDYACNVAMVLAKQVGQAPRAIAEQLHAALGGTIPNVATIEIAGPGFLNFHLTRDFYASEIQRINALGEQWGKNDSWAGKKVLVEYTDPNPFKEFHIGHLFTNTVGEAIARLFDMNGANTKRCNYQGDVGLHVAHALYGMQQLNITPESVFDAKDLGKAYALGATAYKENEAAKAAIREINKKVYDRSDVDLNALYDKGRAVSLQYFETIYTTLGTKFDEYFFESEAGPKGKELVAHNPDIFTDSDGAKVFDGEQYGLHTRVFLNSEGLPTYEAKELALAKMKEDRLGAYDHSVISTANEITEYFKVLKKAMSFIYPELEQKTEHVGHGTVRLTSGKMSSRTGDIIPATQFIADIALAAQAKMDASLPTADAQLAQTIAIAAIKYATLKGNILQDSVFDKEKALSFEGDSGPYLQYTYARISSVLEKATSAGVQFDTVTSPENAYEIEKVLYRFEEVIKDALIERAPHQVVGYLTELAGMFNTFYAHEKIADANGKFAGYKAALARAVAQTIKNGLWTLGIEAPERM